MTFFAGMIVGMVIMFLGLPAIGAYVWYRWWMK
jgi:hypothetical protein